MFEALLKKYGPTHHGYGRVGCTHPFFPLPYKALAAPWSEMSSEHFSQYWFARKYAFTRAPIARPPTKQKAACVPCTPCSVIPDAQLAAIYKYQILLNDD